MAVWSHYAGAGPVLKFVRVGTLDNPDLLPPQIHIFTVSKQPWVVLSKEIPAVPEYYDREKYWPTESLTRRASHAAAHPGVPRYEASRFVESTPRIRDTSPPFGIRAAAIAPLARRLLQTGWSFPVGQPLDLPRSDEQGSRREIDDFMTVPRSRPG